MYCDESTWLCGSDIFDGCCLCLSIATSADISNVSNMSNASNSFFDTTSEADADLHLILHKLSKLKQKAINIVEKESNLNSIKDITDSFDKHKKSLDAMNNYGKNIISNTNNFMICISNNRNISTYSNINMRIKSKKNPSNIKHK